MNEYADSVKGKLENVLNEIHESSRLFVKNPMKDFTRKRKLDFKDMLTKRKDEGTVEVSCTYML